MEQTQLFEKIRLDLRERRLRSCLMQSSSIGIAAIYFAGDISNLVAYGQIVARTIAPRVAGSAYYINSRKFLLTAENSAYLWPDELDEGPIKRWAKDLLKHYVDKKRL